MQAVIRSPIKEKLKRSKLFIKLLCCLPSWVLGLRKVVAITMEVSSACNFKCPFCPVGNRTIAPAFMDLATHQRVIDLLPKSVKILRYSYRGDATLNPDFVKMIRYAHEKGFKTDMSTNGMLIERYVDELVESGLNRIIFALDGATQQVQEKYRIGSDLRKIKNNIRLLVNARKNSSLKFPKEITIQTVVSRNNEEQITDLIKMAEDSGVDKIKFKTMAVNLGGVYYMSEKNQQDFLPKNPSFLRKGQDILLCPALGETVILYNGDVSVCCNDYAAGFVVGNIIKENSFEKVVYNRKYNQYRKRILRKGLPLCRNCPTTGDYWIPEISRTFANDACAEKGLR